MSLIALTSLTRRADVRLTTQFWPVRRPDDSLTMAETSDKTTRASQPVGHHKQNMEPSRMNSNRWQLVLLTAKGRQAAKAQQLGMLDWKQQVERANLLSPMACEELYMEIHICSGILSCCSQQLLWLVVATTSSTFIMLVLYIVHMLRSSMTRNPSSKHFPNRVARVRVKVPSYSSRWSEDA